MKTIPITKLSNKNLIKAINTKVIYTYCWVANECMKIYSIGAGRIRSSHKARTVKEQDTWTAVNWRKIIHEKKCRWQDYTIVPERSVEKTRLRVECYIFISENKWIKAIKTACRNSGRKQINQKEHQQWMWQMKWKWNSHASTSRLKEKCLTMTKDK